jgi:hypothetical protein
MRRRQATIQELRRAIECLPVKTRIAMLEGIRGNEIIVGAYTDGSGGVCPMLAAHRLGGRTDFIGFARAWDRFAGAGRRARRATRREVLILTSHLEASLLELDAPSSDLGDAVREHRELMARRRVETAAEWPTRQRSAQQAPAVKPRPGDPDRGPELRTSPGWSWLRVFRRYDDYQRALARVESEQEALGGTAEQEALRGAAEHEAPRGDPERRALASH